MNNPNLPHCGIEWVDLFTLPLFRRVVMRNEENDIVSGSSSSSSLLYPGSPDDPAEKQR